MVTYWLEGKKTSLASRDVSPDVTTKCVAMETEREAELLPGLLDEGRDED